MANYADIAAKMAQSDNSSNNGVVEYTSGYRASYLKSGKTKIFPVEFPAGASFIQPTVNVWTKTSDPKPANRFIIGAIVISADDESGLHESFTTQIQFLETAIIVGRSITNLLADEDEPARVSTIDENGVLTLGDLFEINRTGAGTDTSYTVRVLQKVPKDLPSGWEIPTIGVLEFAQQYREWQMGKLKRRQQAALVF